MRHVLCLAQFLLVLPAFAQKEPIPDTTNAWRYFPLEVGNEWEYAYGNPMDKPAVRYLRYVIVDERDIEGQHYFIREVYEAEEGDAGWHFRWEEPVRFDTLTAEAVRLTTTGEVAIDCPFDTPFNGVVACGDPPGLHTAVGIYESMITVGEDAVPTDAIKHFYPKGPVDTTVPVYAADFGLVGETIGIDPFEFFDFEYTRLVREDGSIDEYGRRVPLNSETVAPASWPIAISAYPNPFAEAVTLSLDVPAPQRVTVEVFDMLGCRVHAEERTAGGAARIRLDAAGWSSGLYVVRLGTAEGQAVTARVVKR